MCDYNKLESSLREITGEECYNSSGCKNLYEISEAADAIKSLRKGLTERDDEIVKLRKAIEIALYWIPESQK